MVLARGSAELVKIFRIRDILNPNPIEVYVGKLVCVYCRRLQQPNASPLYENSRTAGEP